MADRAADSLGRADFWHELKRVARRKPKLREKAFSAFSERGGYPLAHALADEPWGEVAQQLNETIIRRVITHDLRVGDRGRRRDPGLLEEVFRLGCRYVGQCPGPQKLLQDAQKALGDKIGVDRIKHYLEVLDMALLLRQVPPLELRMKRSRGAAKLCLVDHGLRASWLQEVIPIEPSKLRDACHQCDLAGRIVESVVGAYFLGLPGIGVSHFPERKGEPEVDFVLTLGDKRIPIEVKYRRRVDLHDDTAGLRSFLGKSVYNAPFGVMVTQDEIQFANERIICVPLPALLSLY